MIEMIKIYKTDVNGVLEELKEIEENCWIDLMEPTEEELKEVVSKTGVSFKHLIKVLDEEELPRIEVEEEETLVVTDFPYNVDRARKNKYTTLPMGMLVSSKNYFLTICGKKHHLLDPFKESKIREFYTDRKTRFVVQILLQVAISYLDELKVINKDITSREKILYKTTENKELLNLLNIEKSLVYFITSLRENEAVLERLEKGEILPLYKEDLSLIHDAIIENRQGIDMANIYREILTSMTDTYATIISNNLNRIMKFLAGITIVFSIPTMIASFMGMNVPLGSFGSHSFSFFFIIIVSFLFAILIAWILKRKNML